MQLGRLLTFRRCLTSTILLLAGLVQALMTVVLASSFEKQAASNLLVARVPVADVLFQAADAVAEESSLALAALAAPRPASDRLEEQVKQSRAQTDREITQALVLLGELREPWASNPSLQTLALELPRFRQALDGVLHRGPASEPAAEIAGRQETAGHSLIEHLERLFLAARDTQARLLAVKDDLEPAASLARMRTVLLGGLAAAQRLDQLEDAMPSEPASVSAPANLSAGRDQLLAYGSISGRLAQAWSDIRRLAAVAEDDGLAAALATVPESLAAPHRWAAPGGGRPAPGAELDHLRRVDLAASAALTAAARELAEAAGGAVVLSITLFAIAICGAAAALALIHFHLFVPLRRLTRTLEAVALGQASRPVPAKLRGGELGALARAVESLRRAADAKTTSTVPPEAA